MRFSGRVAAAIEILTELETRPRPAADALKNWGLSHRFAGSKDRAAIGHLIFGALRTKASSGWRMGADTARAIVLGHLRWTLGMGADALNAAFADDPHAPEPISEAERLSFAEATLNEAPDWVRGDYPEWLNEQMILAFGDERICEGEALAVAAPLDLRANTLKSSQDRVLAALVADPKLQDEAGVATVTSSPWAVDGLRIPYAQGRDWGASRHAAWLKGWFEIQDEGSQIAAAFAGVEPGMQVADVCAGGGGKTLALAAAMANKGQIHAYDVDAPRLAAIRERLDRAGIRNAQLYYPQPGTNPLEPLAGRMDVVLVDAPCTGSGTWRRNPDAKWRIRPGALGERQKEQAEAIAMGAALVKPGGRLVYVTCSILDAENDDTVAAFLAQHAGFKPIGWKKLTNGTVLGELKNHAWLKNYGIQLTPRRTNTDGFYISVLERAG